LASRIPAAFPGDPEARLVRTAPAGAVFHS
jgi:hypothetical protein